MSRSGRAPAHAPAHLPRRRIGSGAVRIALAALLAVLVAGVAFVAVTSGDGPAGGTGTADVATPPLDPAAVDVPAIGARSSLIPLGRDPAGGWAIPPLDQAGQASWYSDGVAPGSPGPAVILGHINGCAALGDDGRCAGERVPGVFARLGEVRAGDEVTVTGRDGRAVTFRAVEDARTVPKDQFPTGEVLGNTPDRVLRLITCGGDYDPAAHRYLDNVIATFIAV